MYNYTSFVSSKALQNTHGDIDLNSIKLTSFSETPTNNV